jgi:hypothetical protein
MVKVNGQITLLTSPKNSENTEFEVQQTDISQIVTSKTDHGDFQISIPRCPDACIFTNNVISLQNKPQGTNFSVEDFGPTVFDSYFDILSKRKTLIHADIAINRIVPQYLDYNETEFNKKLNILGDKSAIDNEILKDEVGIHVTTAKDVTTVKENDLRIIIKQAAYDSNVLKGKNVYSSYTSPEDIYHEFSVGKEMNEYYHILPVFPRTFEIYNNKRKATDTDKTFGYWFTMEYVYANSESKIFEGPNFYANYSSAITLLTYYLYNLWEYNEFMHLDLHPGNVLYANTRYWFSLPPAVSYRKIFVRLSYRGKILNFDVTDGIPIIIDFGRASCKGHKMELAATTYGSLTQAEYDPYECRSGIYQDIARYVNTLNQEYTFIPPAGKIDDDHRTIHGIIDEETIRQEEEGMNYQPIKLAKILDKIFELNYGASTLYPTPDDVIVIFDPPNNYKVFIGSQQLA